MNKMSDYIIYMIGLIPSFIIFVFFMNKIKKFDTKVVELMSHIEKQNVMIYEVLEKKQEEQVNTPVSKLMPENTKAGGSLKWG